MYEYYYMEWADGSFLTIPKDIFDDLASMKGKGDPVVVELRNQADWIGSDKKEVTQ